jgi:hypothetical protein
MAGGLLAGVVLATFAPAGYCSAIPWIRPDPPPLSHSPESKESKKDVFMIIIQNDPLVVPQSNKKCGVVDPHRFQVNK